jgi:hypothetical protein
VNRVQILASGLALSVAGLGVAAHLEGEAAAVRRDTERIQATVQRSQARFQERYDRAGRQLESTTAQFDRRSVSARAVADPHVHLRVDLSASRLALVDDGFVLRDVAVQIGAPIAVDDEAGAGHIRAFDRGIHTVAERVRNGGAIDDEWWSLTSVDGWRDGEALAGERVLVLEDGTAIYGAPKQTSPVDKQPVRPAAVAVPRVDIAAIYGAVAQGTHVYVY